MNNDKEIEQLWNEFADVSVGADDNIEQDFHLWECGECKFHIWRWFDQKHTKGIAFLMKL